MPVPSVLKVDRPHADIGALPRLVEGPRHRGDREHPAAARAHAVRQHGDVAAGGQAGAEAALEAHGAPAARVRGVHGGLLHRCPRVEDVGAGDAERPLQARDRVAPVAPRGRVGVAGAGHDHGHDAEVRPHGEGRVLAEAAAGAVREDLEEVRVEQRERRLRDGVPHAGAERDELRPVRGDHELHVEATHEWPLLLLQAVEDGLHNLGLDALQDILVHRGGRRKGAHALGDGAALVVVRAFLVLHGGGQQHKPGAVAESQDRNLGLRSRALLGRRGSHRHAATLQKGLGELLRGLDLRCGPRGAEGRHAGAAELVGEALAEQCLLADDGEGDVPLLAEVLDFLEVRRRQRHVHRHQRSCVRVAAVALGVVTGRGEILPVVVSGVGDAPITGSDVDATHIVRLTQLPSERVLGAAVADDEHRRHHRGGRGAHAVAPRAAPLVPQHEGAATDLCASWRRVLAGEVPIARILGHGLVQCVDRVEEDADLGLAVVGRYLLHDLRRNLLGREHVVDALHVVHEAAAGDGLRQLRAARCVHLPDDTLLAPLLQERDRRLEGCEVAELGHVDAIDIRVANLRATRDDDDVRRPEPVHGPQDRVPQGVATHDRVVERNDGVQAAPNSAVVHIVRVEGQVLSGRGLLDEGADLGVLVDHLLDPHLGAHDLVELLHLLLGRCSRAAHAQLLEQLVALAIQIGLRFLGQAVEGQL
mmetsp:Transcript_102720/g.296945  ORF Transcript_102720/g.296945 Transcript_102720/m.296945 type:complete len:704 (+) Transcript_102720:2141-4252(+)